MCECLCFIILVTVGLSDTMLCGGDLTVTGALIECYFSPQASS